MPKVNRIIGFTILFTLDWLAYRRQLAGRRSKAFASHEISERP
jgi:hypothetical protein